MAPNPNYTYFVEPGPADDFWKYRILAPNGELVLSGGRRGTREEVETHIQGLLSRMFHLPDYAGEDWSDSSDGGGDDLGIRAAGTDWERDEA